MMTGTFGRVGRRMREEVEQGAGGLLPLPLPTLLVAATIVVGSMQKVTAPFRRCLPEDWIHGQPLKLSRRRKRIHGGVYHLNPEVICRIGTPGLQRRGMREIEEGETSKFVKVNFEVAHLDPGMESQVDEVLR